MAKIRVHGIYGHVHLPTHGRRQTWKSRGLMLTYLLAVFSMNHSIRLLYIACAEPLEQVMTMEYIYVRLYVLPVFQVEVSRLVIKMGRMSSGSAGLAVSGQVE